MTLADVYEYHPIFSSHGLFVTGTDTGVGKTYVSTLLVREFRRLGIPVYGLKPLISGFQREGAKMERDDCELLKEATLEGTSEDYLTPKLREFAGGPLDAFAAALAPVSAARREGRRLDWLRLREETRLLVEECRFNSIVPIVEGAGGALVPLGNKVYMTDLIQSLSLSTVVVCRTALGTINHTLATLEVLESRGIPVSAVVASRNGFTGALEDVERSSLEELAEQMTGDWGFYLVETGGTELKDVRKMLG
jgi:dethiobiotin synthetase